MPEPELQVGRRAVRDLERTPAQRLHLGLAEPHRVGDAQIGVEHAGRAQELHLPGAQRAPAPPLPRPRSRADACAPARPSSAARATVRSQSAREQESTKRGQRAPRILPPASPCQRRYRSPASSSARSGCLEQRARRALAGVHQTLPRHRAQPRVADRAEDPLHAAHEAELLHRGGAGEKTVGRAQKPGRVRGVLGVRRLQRPDALAQPAQERAVLGEAAKEGLTEMHVRLDEAGQDEEAARFQ